MVSSSGSGGNIRRIVPSAFMQSVQRGFGLGITMGTVGPPCVQARWLRPWIGREPRVRPSDVSLTVVAVALGASCL